MDETETSLTAMFEATKEHTSVSKVIKYVLRNFQTALTRLMEKYNETIDIQHKANVAHYKSALEQKKTTVRRRANVAKRVKLTKIASVTIAQAR